MPPTLLALVSLVAQLDTPRTRPDSTPVVVGVVVSTLGGPVPGANVFVEQTLEGTMTDSAGVFRLRTGRRGVVTLVARRIGFGPARRDVHVPSRDTVRRLASAYDVVCTMA